MRGYLGIVIVVLLVGTGCGGLDEEVQADGADAGAGIEGVLIDDTDDNELTVEAEDFDAAGEIKDFGIVSIEVRDEEPVEEAEDGEEDSSDDSNDDTDQVEVLASSPLYYLDTATRRDGKSEIYSIAVDTDEATAEMTLLAEIPFGGAALAVNTDNSLLYVVSGSGKLASYDLASGAFTMITNKLRLNHKRIKGVTQAAMSPDGMLVIASARTNHLYEVDPSTGDVTDMGHIFHGDTHWKLNVRGADIAYASDGTLYMAKRGKDSTLYELTKDGNGTLRATWVETLTGRVTGMAVLEDGEGDFVVSRNGSDALLVTDGAGQTSELELTLDGVAFTMLNGDLAASLAE